ncbi:hypothetical protein PanWU01x14_138440 [Parasponia andersonii]|uniref:Uncharacterized protein n=1 Tax=Parasponia andersonii TaxID=3476 RepID=A0A2P5CNA0_PARAD|nr:hypothetical protein PanWU01x14_138440 [Parasponia andersonii]
MALTSTVGRVRSPKGLQTEYNGKQLTAPDPDRAFNIEAVGGSENQATTAQRRSQKSRPLIVEKDFEVATPASPILLGVQRTLGQRGHVDSWRIQRQQFETRGWLVRNRSNTCPTAISSNVEAFTPRKAVVVHSLAEPSTYVLAVIHSILSYVDSLMWASPP